MLNTPTIVVNAVILHSPKNAAPPVPVRLKLAFKSASTPLVLTADCVVVKVPAVIITPLAIAPVIACSVNDAERSALALTLKLPLAVTVAELVRSAVVLLVLSALAVRAKLAFISAGSASMRLIPTDTVVANAVIFAVPCNTVVPDCVVVNDADNELAPLLILSADAVSDPNPVTTIFPIAVFCAVALRTKLLDKLATPEAILVAVALNSGPHI